MAKFKVEISVEATDIMMAQMAGQGIQNVVDELGEHQYFLIELSNRQVAKSYKDKLMSLLNNPIIKKVAANFGG